MRYLVQIQSKSMAEAFVAYLLTQQIATHIEPTGDAEEAWDVWIRDEDAFDRAQAEWKLFHSNPQDTKYSEAIPVARQIIKQQQEAVRAAAKNTRQVDFRRGGNAGGLNSGRVPPVTLTLLILCIVASLLTNFTRPRDDYGRMAFEQLRFVSESALQTSGDDVAASLKQGQLWRAITPTLLHGDPLHLAMNMMGLFFLGRIAERLVGSRRYLLMALILMALPMLLSSLMPPALGGSPNTIGISGMVYGLASYLWLVSINRPDLGFRIPNNLIIILLVVIVLGFVGVIGSLSNWGHLGGFLVGLALAMFSSR